jgi:hypothetical protein
MKKVRTQLLSTCPSEKQFVVSDKIWGEVYVGCSEEVWNVNFVDHVRYTFDAHSAFGRVDISIMLENAIEDEER